MRCLTLSLPLLLIVLSGCSLLFPRSAQQTYVDNRCEAATETSPHGINHCHDAASIDAYRKDFDAYQQHYRESAKQ